MTSAGDQSVQRHTASLAASPLSTRDEKVIALVGRFRQMTGRQIGDVLFAACRSQTPCDRTAKRLVDRHYLARLERCRLVGGEGGGSTQYVYQLGRLGWKLLNCPGRYWAPTRVNLHTLAVADTYRSLIVAARQSSEPNNSDGFELIRFEPEYPVHAGTTGLVADALIEVGFRQRGVKVSLCLEQDRSTEHARVIREKCVTYWQVCKWWPPEQVFPYVAFVVLDEKRKTEIERVIAGGPDEARALFKVWTVASFPQEIRDMAKQG